MQPSVVKCLEGLAKQQGRAEERLTPEQRVQVAWDFDLTREARTYATEAFVSDGEAAAAGFGHVEEVDGKKRHFRKKLEPLDLTDEECAALSQALANSRGAAVGRAAGRFLLVFGVLFLIGYGLGGILLASMRKSWLPLFLVSVPGCFGGLLMIWVGQLIGEVHHLRGMLMKRGN